MKTALRLLFLLVFLVTSLTPIPSQAQGLLDDSARLKAQTLLAQLTPEERVGQLFLITFKGTDAGSQSQIYDLIVNRHVGGVMLMAANDNFTSADQVVTGTHQLIASLQNAEWEAAQPVTGTVRQTSTPQYIPLFVGISQEGDGSPYDQIINGLTALPNEMALGATWKPSLAQQVGSIMGNELSTLGFNLYIGPSLDVLEMRHVEETVDLGTRTFGGDPYWVGEMGKAYIAGLHTGSQNRLAVIAKHFPGRGSSDRLPEEEVATVRKSLDQLKQIELVPFAAVTGNAPNAESTTDGLLVSHIRYQQGSIRSTTRPVSLDPAALGQLMALTFISSWRNNGGLMVSDDLGGQAMRRFDDPSELTFDARQVARSAFLAGNDLLYADHFVASEDPDTHTTIIRTLEFFAQKYREDPAFAQRVDASVERILTLKYRLYGTFDIANVRAPESSLATLGMGGQQVVFDAARQAVTLISPSENDLVNVIPNPPNLRENLIFFTDTLTARQCSKCPEQSVLSIDALPKTILQLYGPKAGGQVLESHLSYFSFADLSGYLDRPDNADLETKLSKANWVIFSMTGVSSGRPESLALRRLLSEKPGLIRDKKVIVFAFNAPYYLDATDISKLTAYYGLYSKAPGFVDVAARVLFQELTPSGALPVTVTGAGYDLITAMSPDPTQVIPLAIDTLPQVEPTPEAPTIPRFKVGDNVPLKTGPIYDHNHNTVPDGTVVRFIFTTGGDTSISQQVEAVTTQGMARINYRIEKAGLLDIRVISEPARLSDQLRLDIGGDGSVITIVPNTPEPTLTPTPEPTPTLTPT
ncbi:MAG TPA: glycoside hydrolase family 3 N-terminal domain-containing protein, partial [Anaerolineaceae bacterium]|nr:glycoside hydrolase family 3 N-terminal domain-containing protein [Anaerolineaceae bacterium]